MRKDLFLLFAIMLFLTYGCAKQPPQFQPLFAHKLGDADKIENYCHNPEDWAHFTGLLHKYPDNDSVFSLYALKMGLCEMIELELIEFDRANILFEQMRESAIKVDQARKMEAEKKGEGI